jgi:ADP-glucose type glycogen/starch synthase
MAEVSATIVEQLRLQGADIHLAIPHYRHLFTGASFHCCLGGRSRVHLAEDSSFYRCPSAYFGDLLAVSLSFQREVINHIIPLVQPDIVHCNDWMTGLIPAACKKLGIKTLFTVHNIHRERTTLAEIEARGIDASSFWESLHYEHYPYTFEQSYHHNAIDALSSAIINADYVSTVSPTFLKELSRGIHGELPGSVLHDLYIKTEAGYASGILNSPGPAFNPACDSELEQCYTPKTHREQKAFHKASLQKELGLIVKSDAPLLYWPSRLDPTQKGCQLLTNILHDIMEAYRDEFLELVIVGDGPFQCHFHDIVAMHGLSDHVAIAGFEEGLSHRAFAASDFVLMPSSFEPCGLPQMIGLRYGSVPIAHNTGGLHDTVTPFSDDYTEGNGVRFDYFDSNGLRWAIDTAMTFYRQPADLKGRTIRRTMEEALYRFDNGHMFHQYKEVYQKLARDRTTQTREPTP